MAKNWPFPKGLTNGFCQKKKLEIISFLLNKSRESVW